jgi:hypothetical protein
MESCTKNVTVSALTPGVLLIDTISRIAATAALATKLPPFAIAMSATTLKFKNLKQ